MTSLVFAFTHKDHLVAILDAKKPNLLVSYYYLKDSPSLTNSVIDSRKNYKIDILMLDSGAYSAWSNGKLIPLYDYIDFVKKYHTYFTHIVCLDVIDNPLYSEVNHLIMLEELRELDLTIIPVFHSGEPFSVLDYMVNKGYKYIGISPNNNWGEKQKRVWLTKVFTRYDFNKLNIQTHGFGYNSIEGLPLFPLTTADSHSCFFASRNGEIIDLDGSIAYSDWGSQKKRYHINDVEGHSDFVLKLCSRLKISPDNLRSDYHARDLFNLEAIEELINRDKKNISNPITELFEDNEEFREQDILEIFNECRVKGRDYLGVPDNWVSSIKRSRKKRKSIQGKLF